MEKQPEAKTQCIAVQRLRELQPTLLQQSQELVLNRARVEKYRKTHLAKAQACYQELENSRMALLSTFQEIQLNLLELENNKLAAVAGKLHQGLSGFQLMSGAYKPVYEVFVRFAKQLPVTEYTVNAAVIGRLMNYVRMGYYPTDPENIDHILRAIQFPDGVTTNLLDPCCGCGKALRQLATGNNCFTYGVELDECRAEEAQTMLHRVGMGSFFHSKISSEAFHLLFLNPPYLSVMTEGGGRTRYEKRFLVESIRHLMMGGLLIYIVPYYRLTEDICRMLADNFSDLSIWRFTDREFARFRQVAVLGLRKPREDHTPCELQNYACDPDAIPSITQIDALRYVLPDTPKAVAVFKGEKFNEKELERQLCRSNSLQRLIRGKSELDSTQKRPLLPLSIGQIGLVGGSGMINGLIECDTPHIIKGRIIKVKHTDREEKYGCDGSHEGAEIREVVSNKMVFNVLTPTGFKALT